MHDTLSWPSGKDGSEAFEDVGHSPDARELQQQYLIGEVTEPAAKRPKVSFYCKCTLSGQLG